VSSKNSAVRRNSPDLGHYLVAVRGERGLSQTEFARRCGLVRQEIAYFETNARKPSLKRLLQIAQAFDLPLQRFLTGINQPGRELKDIAVELRDLGLIDLWVEGPSIPGAFRRCEEVVALAVAGKEPAARIVEGVPALLAWNRWNGSLLRAFAREIGRATVYRLAWLADITLALERQGGFPGGCPGKENLARFVKLIKRPPLDRWDDLGHPADGLPTSPIWKRWRINYAATLDTFRQRAEALLSLAQAEGRTFPPQR
jgi:transcriptional regulator with XRE-family HTH domain